MEDMKPKSLMKAVQKLVGQAATAVEDEERQKHYASLMAQQAGQQSFPYWQNRTTTAANTQWGAAGSLGQSSTSGVANLKQAYQNVYGGGSPGQTQWTTGYANVKPASVLTFTDEQMSLFMEKLAHLLSKGWECLRCHRIWNPRETGCEFCNFIDRLEGKDVERDTAA